MYYSHVPDMAVRFPALGWASGCDMLRDSGRMAYWWAGEPVVRKVTTGGRT